MAAQTMTTAVTLFAGPGTLNCGTPNGTDSVSFRIVLDGTIRTLSNNNPPAENSYRGMLFVPGLDAADTCNNITAPYIPESATRRIDLPDYDHEIIGLAPWVNKNCTQAYLAASRRENARAVIFYQPDSHDTNKPPPKDDRIWDLGDDYQWKIDYEFPVYAIPGPSGSKLMRQLSHYSGRSTNDNKSTEPSEAQYAVRCARLYALLDFAPETSSSVPGIWVFVLAILGVLVFLMLVAYLTAQHIQKKRRENLQQRLVAGEIDLEHLGIKRLVVPPHLLSQLPVYVYPEETGRKSSSDPERKSHETNTTQKMGLYDSTEALNAEAGEDRQSPPQPLIHQEHYDESISAILEEVAPHPQPPRTRNGCRLTFSQLTCAICLEDFVPGSSLVRELPCTHIFHPECVDTFLMRDGSTCPVCKHNVLPPSFISDQVTNFMVRREQRMRRLNSHQDRELELQGLYLTPFERIQARIRGSFRRNRSGSSSPPPPPEDGVQTDPGLQQAQMPLPHPQSYQNSQPGQHGEDHDQIRREMMQRRAMALLGTPVNNGAIRDSEETHPPSTSGHRFNPTAPECKFRNPV